MPCMLPVIMDYGWTIEKVNWQLMKNTIREDSPWRISGLRPGGAAGIPSKPGIYMLCVRPLMCEDAFVMDSDSKDAKGLYSPLYIGESENLKERYKNYANLKDRRRRVKKFLTTFRGKIDFCYWILEGATKAYLEDVQNLLILCFGPSVNTKGGGNELKGVILTSMKA